MHKFKTTACKLVFNCLMLVLGTVLLVKALSLALSPSLHVDESYYIGAARKILSGDVLLTSFVFDKLFLQPFVVAFGILFLGPTVLGFRIAGILLMLATFVVLKRAFSAFGDRTTGHAIGIETNYLGSLACAGLAFAFLLMPVVIQHESSAMTEPALVFFLALAALRTVRSEAPVAWAVPWTLAAFAKMSAVMWLPFFVLADLILWKQSPKAIAVQFWARTRWYWAVAIVFQLFNRKKFAAFSWFTHLGQNQKQKTSLFERTAFWFETLNAQTLFVGSLVLIASAVVAILILRKLRRRMQLSVAEQWAFVACLGAIGHMVGVPLSGAPLYERYLITLYPLLGFAAISIIVFFAQGKTVSALGRTISLTAVSVLLIGIGARSALSNGLPLEPMNERGRVLEVVSQIIPDDASIASPLLWELYPYESTTWVRSMCERPECLWAQRAGLSDPLSYVVSASDSGAISFQRAPLVIGGQSKMACKIDEKTLDAVSLKSDLRSSILSEMRVKNSESFQDLKIESSDSAVVGDDFMVGLPAGFKVVESKFEIEVRGHFQLIPSFDSNRSVSDPGLVFIVTRVQALRPFAADGTDLLPFIWKKRVLRIARFDLPMIEREGYYRLLSLNLPDNSLRLSVQNCR